MMRKLVLASLAGVVLAANVAAAQEPAEPNPQLTPGAIASHDPAEVCARDSSGRHMYSQAHRVWRDKSDTLAK